MRDDEDLRVDEQLLLLMDQLEALEEKRGKLNSLIEEGWFSIAKARYSMGNKQVSALQYARDMQPLVHVEASLLESGTAEFICNRAESKSQELGSDTIEDICAKEGGLRRRVHAKPTETKEEKISDEKQETDPQVKTDNRDPLKWFGILVPQHLKRAQVAFKEVIALTAEIASLQSTILATRKEMQSQMKVKQEKTKPDIIKE